MKLYYGIAYLFIGMFILTISGIALKNRKNHIMLWFGLLMLAMSINNLGYALELLSVSINHMYFWHRSAYLGISFYPVLIFLFIREVTSLRWITRWFIFAVAVVNMVTLILVLTNNWHNLYFSAVVLVPYGSNAQLLSVTYGPWFDVATWLLNVALVFALIILVYRFIRSQGRAKLPAAIFIVAFMMPVATYIIDIFLLPETAIKIGPISFLVMGLLVLRGLTKYRHLFVSGVAYQYIVNSLEDLILIFDVDGQLLYANPAAKEMMTPMDLVQGLSVYDSPKLKRYFEAADGVLIHDFGEDFKVKIIDHLAIHIRIVMLNKVTDLVEAQNYLYQLARMDALTEIPNRMKMIEDYEEQQGFGYFVLLDIDHFKAINDTYGHSHGDQILKAFGKRMAECCEGHSYCRYGGEEFAVLLRETTLEAVRESVECLRHSFAEEGHTVSAGIAAFEKTSFDDVVKEADIQLYLAKDNGRNAVYYENERL